MKVYAPNIHLFAFQLYKNANGEEIDKIWHSADYIIGATLQQDLQLISHLDVNQEPQLNKTGLLKKSLTKDGDDLPVEGKITFNNQPIIITGFVYPCRIYDSYGLWLNLRRPEKNDDDTPTTDLDVSWFSQINPLNCFTLPENKLFLGQTLLITAWLTGAKNTKDIHNIATACLQSTFPHPSEPPSFSHQGELFGSPIFEYGLFGQLNTYQHVIVWLFADEKADAYFNQCSQELLDLWFFRTKIIKAYKNSREIYQELASAYKNIEEVVENLPSLGEKENLSISDLNQLKQKLNELPQLSLKYTRLLQLFKNTQNTINIHRDNYSDRLQKIKGKLSIDDLQFLEFFVNKNCPFFQQQITADLGYFDQGSHLLEQAIAIIRGIIETEQAKRDRSLEQTIQVLGIAFGGGAIVSGVVTQHIDKPFAPTIINLKYPIHPLVSSLLLSALATIVFWLLARWRFTQPKHKGNKR
ncbi:MAG: hypothetical protein QNJ63_22640 [Calothrix sp. MO_192.B10]|nr:hypothetical protein [Calothrix sp. MO_192.B10]